VQEWLHHNKRQCAIGVDMCPIRGWFHGTHAQELGQALVWPIPSTIS
jgi:hypothetical protein